MKKNKKFKGMTLVEIIVSIAILGVLTLVLVQTSTVINMYIKSANNVNKKTISQAPVAEMGNMQAATQVATNAKIKISGGGFADVELYGDAYQAGTRATEIVKDADGNDVVVEKNELGGNLNMQFLVLEDPTSPVTTAPAGP